MEQIAGSYPGGNHIVFDEGQWLKMIFLLSDTQTWLNELLNGLITQLPIDGKKKLMRKTYYLSVQTLAHILERHYHKIQRYPNTSKFIIPVADILTYIRDSFTQSAVPLTGSHYFRREFNTGNTIGFDRSGQNTSIITILSDPGGRIITAFPGSVDS